MAIFLNHYDLRILELAHKLVMTGSCIADSGSEAADVMRAVPGSARLERYDGGYDLWIAVDRPIWTDFNAGGST